MKSYKNRSYKKKHSLRGGEDSSFTDTLNTSLETITPKNLMQKEESWYEKIKNKATSLKGTALSFFGGSRKNTKKRVRFSTRNKGNCSGCKTIKKSLCNHRGTLKKSIKGRSCNKKTGPKCK